MRWIRLLIDSAIALVALKTTELATGVFLADLTAYVLGWAWRLKRMSKQCRDEMKSYAGKLHDMQFQGEKPQPNRQGHWPLHGITYLDDLRGRFDGDED